MSVTQIATIEPISVADAKKWLLIDYDDQDAIIESIIKAARLKIEKRCGIAIALKQYEMKTAAFDGNIELSHPPIVSVDSIKFLDEDGIENTLDDASYELMHDDYAPYVFPTNAWPTGVAHRPDGVRRTFTSGIDIEDSPVDDIPEDLKQAIRLVIGEMYENRQDEMMLPTRQELGVLSNGVMNLISPYIVPRL